MAKSKQKLKIQNTHKQLGQRKASKKGDRNRFGWVKGRMEQLVQSLLA